MNGKDIRKTLKRIHRSLSSKSKVDMEKIIPVAFPILLSTWKVRIKLSKPTGLVERFILKAIRDFGPCDVVLLDDLLCFGEERLKNAVRDMIELGAPIISNNDVYSFADDGSIEFFSKLTEHNFKFVVNGISGELLPVNFARHITALSLEEQDDNDGKLPYRKIPSIMNGYGSPAIHRMKEGSNSKDVDVGVPDGFVGFAENQPLSENVKYILSFLIKYVNGDVKLIAATDECIELMPAKDKRIAHQFEKHINSRPTLPSHGDGIKVKQSSTAVLDIFADNLLGWKNETTDAKERIHSLTGDFIKYGWTWDHYLGQNGYFKLRPGDEKTAKALFMIRTESEAQQYYTEWDTPAAFASWYENKYNVFSDAYQILKDCPSCHEFTDYIMKSSDNGDFKDAMIKFSQVHVKAKTFDNDHSAATFITSKDEGWTDFILKAFSGATQTLKIITPVINDDSVFDLLGEANKRGVYLQVITPLKEKNSFKSNPLFKDYALPRQKLSKLGASVRSMKAIAHAKIIVVDDCRLYFMSANLNANSLGRGGDKSAIETCMLIENHQIVRDCIKTFHEMWDHAQFKQGRIGTGTSISELSQRDFVSSRIRYAASDMALFVSTPQNHALSNKISKMIRHAKKSVVLVAMSCYDLKRVPELYNVILHALSREVSVTAVLRTGVEQFKEEWPDPSTIALVEAGMKIKEVPHLHAKCVVADSKEVLLMSANLNQFSLGSEPTSHIEMGIEVAPSCKAYKNILDFVDIYMR